MQKFQDVVLDSQGRPVAGAVIAVLSYPGGSPATVYQTDAVETAYTPTTDDYGAFYFYAPDGNYSYTVTVNGVLRKTVTDVQIVDAVAAVATLEASIAALPAYAEGTFTPSIAGDITPGSASYSTRSGYYTKVGRLVTVIIQMTFGSYTGAGYITVTGLPFASRASAPVVWTTPILPGFTWTTDSLPVARLGAGSSVVYLEELASGGLSTPFETVGTLASINLNFSYYV